MVPSSQTSVDGVPISGLLILTGASHTGKTSVAREILRLAAPPAALLSVDNVLDRVLSRPADDHWAQIPLAYELLRPQVKMLLDRCWLVVFESTFTYVPPTGSPEFHTDALDSLVGVAEHSHAPWTVVQLVADESDIASRVEASKRLPYGIVTETTVLHATAALPQPAIQLNASRHSPEELARRSLFGLASVRQA